MLGNRFGNQGVINLANNFTCGRNYIMGDIVTFAAPYLYPFVVEYSLIASAVIFAMWRSIGSNPRYSTINNLLEILGFETHTLGNILWNKILYPNLVVQVNRETVKKKTEFLNELMYYGGTIVNMCRIELRTLEVFEI